MRQPVTPVTRTKLHSEHYAKVVLHLAEQKREKMMHEITVIYPTHEPFVDTSIFNVKIDEKR